MLEAARAHLPAVEFAFGDLTIWLPPDPADLLFSNATLQWVPQHLAVMERLALTLNDGGVLAVQMPDNLDEPSHRLMREAAEHGPWARKLREAAAARSVLPPPASYYKHLKPLFRHLDIWHTIYNHPLDGVDGIISWLGSTGLRPFLAPLDEREREAFLARYRALLASAYPVQDDGKVLLRFPRLFVVGVR
jgi:trans-aconitate 2-methyltransferase